MQKSLLLALLCALVLRLAFGLLYWQGKPLTHDEREYLAFAMNLAAGRGFVRELPSEPPRPSEEVFSRAPMYAAALAGLFLVTGQPTDRLPSSVPRSVQIVQSFWGVLVVWLVARLATRAAGRRSGVVAAWLAALYPPLVWSCAYALSEAFYSPLVLTSVLLAGRAVDVRRARRGWSPAWRLGVGAAVRLDQPGPGATRRTAGRGRTFAVAFAAGIVAGVAALTRSAALVFVALTASWMLAQRDWRLAAALVVGAVLVVAPWTLRNVAVHGRLIVVAADGGVTFWTGNHPLAIGEGDMAANPHIKADHVEFRRRLQHLSPEAREPHYYRAALAWIAAHPLDWAILLLKKFFYTWVPIGPSYTLHSDLYYWTTVATYVPLLLLAMIGLPRLAQSTTPPIALGLLVASSALVCVIFFPQERFRIPAVDPALCVAAGVFLAGLKAGPIQQA